MWKIHWPPIAPDSIQSVTCSGIGATGLGIAHRSCLDGGMWGSVDVSDCESAAIRAVRMKVGQPHIYIN